MIHIRRTFRDQYIARPSWPGLHKRHFHAGFRCRGIDPGWVGYVVAMIVLVFAFASPSHAAAPRSITIDGTFSDWATVPSYFDPTDDQHDTDHDGQFETPDHVAHADVDLLEFKFAHDENNLYAYFRSRT
jgi:hypothetical protein